MKKIHGGQVKQLVINSGKTYTKESLVEFIHETFGEDTRFFSCSADNLTAEELISFFENNGKLSAPHYNFAESAEHSCHH